MTTICAFPNEKTASSSSYTLEFVTLSPLFCPTAPTTTTTSTIIPFNLHKRGVTIGPTSHISPTASARHTSPYQRTSTKHPFLQPSRDASTTVTTAMTNTNSRMENGANLSQSMDSVNNVNVIGEEEVRTNYFRGVILIWRHTLSGILEPGMRDRENVKVIRIYAWRHLRITHVFNYEITNE